VHPRQRASLRAVVHAHLSVGRRRRWEARGVEMGKAASGMDERYFLQKVRLGQGSFGTVWRAIDRRTGAAVAMKQMEKAKLSRLGWRREDVEREVAMMQACAHENITRLFDMFEDEVYVYLAQEYCDGSDLGDKIRERGLAIREAEAALWVRQMCSAIAALHSLGICHRDIKPPNFMVKAGEASVGEAASSGTLKLADFGMAVFLPKGSLLTQKCGTPAFMAPEQHAMSRSRGYSFPADVWAAGVSMYQVMFGGLHPFLDSKGMLKEEALLRGDLDFRPSGANGLPLRSGAQRFTDPAVALCRAMVERSPMRRLTAAGASRSQWATSGREAGSAMLQQQSLPAQLRSRDDATDDIAHPRHSSRRLAWRPGTSSEEANSVDWSRSPMSWRGVLTSPSSRGWRPYSASPERRPRILRGGAEACPLSGEGARSDMLTANLVGRKKVLGRTATEGWMADESDTMTAFVVGAREVLDTTAEVHRSMARLVFGGCGRGSPNRRPLSSRPQRPSRAADSFARPA